MTAQTTARTPEWRFDYPMIVSDVANVDVAQVLYSGDEFFDRATGAMIVDRLNAYDAALNPFTKTPTTADDPTLWRIYAGDASMVAVPGIVKPLQVGSAKRAAQLVTACNTHDELVAALRLAVPLVNRCSQTGAAVAKAAIKAALAKVTP